MDIEATILEIQAFAQRWFLITLRDHQLVWLRFILEGGDRIHLESPRRHGKSILLRVYMLWRICKDRHIRILVVANTEHLSSSIIRSLQRIIEHNKDEFADLYGIYPGRPWKATEMMLSGDVINSDSTLMGKAASARVTGLSSDIILMDDVVIPDSIRTAQQYRRLKEWIIGELWNTLDPMKELVLILGTRKGITDWYSELLDNPDVRCRVDAAIKEDGTPLWPKEGDAEGRGFTLEMLEKKRRQDPELFAREWMNQPSLPKGYRFQREWISTFQALPPAQFIDYHMGIDPGHGLGDRASYFAIVVVAQDTRNNDCYLVEMFRDRIALDIQIEKAEYLYRKYEPKHTICEDVMGYKYLAKDFAKKLPLMTTRDYMHEALKGTDQVSKEARIESRLVPLFKEKKIYTKDAETDHFTRIFIERELLQFGGGGTGGKQGNSEMDLLDALVLAIDEIVFEDDEEPLIIRSFTPRRY